MANTQLLPLPGEDSNDDGDDDTIISLAPNSRVQRR